MPTTQGALNYATSSPSRRALTWFAAAAVAVGLVALLCDLFVYASSVRLLGRDLTPDHRWQTGMAAAYTLSDRALTLVMHLLVVLAGLAFLGRRRWTWHVVAAQVIVSMIATALPIVPNAVALVFTVGDPFVRLNVFWSLGRSGINLVPLTLAWIVLHTQSVRRLFDDAMDIREPTVHAPREC